MFEKSGKTTTAAMATLYVVICLRGRYAESYCVANDFDQAQGRVFQAVVTFVLLMLSAISRQVMIDLGANAGAILAIAVALYLLAGRSSDGRELLCTPHRQSRS